jgi:hypothetical protein
VDKVSPLNDDGFQSSGGTYNWATSASGVLAQEPELVLAINAEAYGNVTAYSAAGYTQEIFQATPTGALAVLDQLVSSTSSVAPSGTYTAKGGTWVGSLLIAYK